MNGEAYKYFIEDFSHWCKARKHKEEHKSLHGDMGKVGDLIITDEDYRNEE